MQLLRLAGVASLVLLVHVGVASAQTRSQRPYRGLFGTDPRTASESLFVSTAMGAGWDTSVAADLGSVTAEAAAAGAVPQLALTGASYGFASTNMVYARAGRRIDFGLSASTANRYYQSFADPHFGGYSGSGTATLRLGRSTIASLSASGSHQPSAPITPFPVLSSLGTPTTSLAAQAFNLNLRAMRQDLTLFQGSVNLDHQLSRRVTLTGLYFRQSANRGDGYGRFSSDTASGRFSYRLSQGLSVRLGYGHTGVQFAGNPTAVNGQQIDGGIDFNRPLSISRDTTLEIQTGLTSFTYANVTRYDAVGSAMLVHMLGRTWTMSGAYRRGVQVNPTLNQPIVADSVITSLGGLVNRRLEVSTGAGASSGLLGFTTGRNTSWSYFGTSNAGFALGRFLAVNGGYNYYFFNAKGTTWSELGFPSTLNRHSFSVFMSTWAPILQKGRRTDASR